MIKFNRTMRDSSQASCDAQSISDESLFDPPHLVVRRSSISGQGLFSTKFCRKGEVLMIITGEVIDAKESYRRQIEEGNCYIYLLGNNLFIDPPLSAKSRYPNHSCQPNAIPESRDERTLYLRALFDIAADEEITIDYDFNEIYDLCRRANPLCLLAECPLNRG
jgi:uncharacterized protein